MKVESLNQHNFCISMTSFLGITALTMLVLGILSHDILHFIPSNMAITCVTIGFFIIPIAYRIVKNLQESKKKLIAWMTQQRAPLADDALTTKYITRKQAICDLTKINDLSLEEIEKRAYQQDPFHQSKAWESCTGFLGFREKIKDILWQDWEIVQRSGWTHQELADDLHEIVTLASQCSCPHDGIIEYRGQKLHVAYSHKDRGLREQGCLFDLYPS